MIDMNIDIVSMSYLKTKNRLIMVFVLGMVGIIIFIGLLNISMNLIDIYKALEKIKDKL
jgi:hypothetical protein